MTARMDPDRLLVASGTIVRLAPGVDLPQIERAVKAEDFERAARIKRARDAMKGGAAW